MKKTVTVLLSLVLAIIGAQMVYTGYNEPTQAKKEFQIKTEMYNQGEADETIRRAKEESAEAIKKSQADYQRTMNESAADIENNKLPRAQLQPLFDEVNQNLAGLKQSLSDNSDKLNDHLDYVLLENTEEVRGTMKYCTGWILISAACIVFSLGLESKPKTL